MMWRAVNTRSNRNKGRVKGVEFFRAMKAPGAPGRSHRRPVGPIIPGLGN